MLLDDITQPEEPGIGKSFEKEKHEAANSSNEVDIKAENNACEFPKAIEQGTTYEIQSCCICSSSTLISSSEKINK